MAENKGAEIARAYVLVIPSLQGAQKTLTNEFVPDAEAAGTLAGTKMGGTFAAALGVAAKAAGAALLAAMTGAVALIKEGVELYAEAEQLRGGIEKLFGTASSAVIANAGNAWKTAGMSANAYMQTVTGISAALLKSGMDASEAAAVADRAMQQMADNANTFGTKSTEEIGQVYQALARGSYAVLDQLNLGYGGTKQGMLDLIAEANRWAQANGKAADLSIDRFEDIVTAIGYVQEELGIAGTTAQEAANTVSGSIGMLKSAWENWLTALGDPSADVQALTQDVLDAFDAVVENLGPVVSQVTIALATEIPGLIADLVDKIPDIVDSLVEAFKDPENQEKLIAAGKKLWEWIKTGIVNAMGSLQDLIDGWIRGNGLATLDTSSSLQLAVSGASGAYSPAVTPTYTQSAWAASSLSPTHYTTNVTVNTASLTASRARQFAAMAGR